MASRRAVSGRGGAAPAPATFAAYPSVVHFGGYKVGQPCTATVRIVNVSGSSAKCDILGPAADEGFSMQHALRVHDRLPPGIGESVTVTFTGREWKYHYDFIRVVSDGQELRVGLHAYPVMHKFSIPKQLTFPDVELGQPVTKVLPLSSAVPVEFEFTLAPVETHPSIQLAPLSGVIPGNGSVQVKATFTPLDFSTVFAEYDVSCSQFDFTPFRMRIVGNAKPGATRARLLAEAVEGGEAPPSTQALDIAGTYASTRRGPGAGAVADPGDALRGPALAASKRRVALREARARAESKAAEARGEGDLYQAMSARGEVEGEGEVVVDGLRLPRRLAGQAAVNDVLMQAPGKLRAKDVGLAVASHRAMVASQTRAMGQGAEPAAGTRSARDLRHAQQAAGPGLSLQEILLAEKAASWLVRAIAWAGGLGFTQASREADAEAQAGFAALRSKREALEGLFAKMRKLRSSQPDSGAAPLSPRATAASLASLQSQAVRAEAELVEAQALVAAKRDAARAAARGDFSLDLAALAASVEDLPATTEHPVDVALERLSRAGGWTQQHTSAYSLPGATSPYAAQVAAAQGRGGGDAPADATPALAPARHSRAGLSPLGADIRSLRAMLFASKVRGIHDAEAARRTTSQGEWGGEPGLTPQDLRDIKAARQELARLECIFASRLGQRRRHMQLHGEGGGTREGGWTPPPPPPPGGPLTPAAIASVAAAPLPPGRTVVLQPEHGTLRGLEHAEAAAAAEAAGEDEVAAEVEVAARRAALLTLRDLFTTRVIRDRADRRLGALRRRLAHVWRLDSSDVAGRRAAVADVVQRDAQLAAAGRDAADAWLSVAPGCLAPDALVPQEGGEVAGALVLGGTLVPSITGCGLHPTPSGDVDAMAAAAAAAPGGHAALVGGVQAAALAGVADVQEVVSAAPLPDMGPLAAAVGLAPPVSDWGADLWPLLRHVSASGATTVGPDGLAHAVGGALGVDPTLVALDMALGGAGALVGSRGSGGGGPPSPHPSAGRDGGEGASAVSEGGGELGEGGVGNEPVPPSLTRVRAGGSVLPALQGSPGPIVAAVGALGGATLSAPLTPAYFDAQACFADDGVVALPLPRRPGGGTTLAPPLPPPVAPSALPLATGRHIRSGAQWGDPLWGLPGAEAPGGLPAQHSIAWLDTADGGAALAPAPTRQPLATPQPDTRLAPGTALVVALAGRGLPGVWHTGSGRMAEVMGPPPDLRWLLPPPSLLPGPVPPVPPHPAAATAHPHAMVLARRDRAAQTQGLQGAVAAFLEHVQAEHPDAAAGMAAVLAALGLPSAAPAPTSGRPGSKKGGRGGGAADSTGREAEGVAAWQPPSSPETGGDAWSHSAAGSAEGGPTTAPWRRYAEDDPMAALEPWAHPAPELGPPLSPWYAVWLQCNGGVPPAAVVGSTATDSVPAPGKREVQALAPIRSVPTVPGTPAAALVQRWRATGVVVDGLRLAPPGETPSGGGDIVAPPPALGQAPQPELGSGGPTPHGSLTRPGGSFMALSANGAQVLEPPLAPGGVSLVGAVAVSALEPLPEGVGEVPAQSMTGPASGAGAPPAGWGSPPTAGFAPGSITLVDAPDPLLPLDAAGGPTLRREAYAGTPGLNCLAMAPGTPPAPWLVTPAHPGPSRPHLDWAAGWGSDVAAVLGSGDTAAVGQGVLPPATAAWLEGGEEGAVEAPSNPLPNPLQAPAEDGARSGRAKTPPSRGSGRGAAKSSKASDLPPAPTPPVSRRAVSLADLPPALAALLQPAEPLSGGLGSTAPGGRGPGPAADLGALALPPLGPPACVPPCSGSASGVPGEVPLGAPAPGWAAAVPSLPLLPAGRAEDVLSDDSESDAEEDAAVGGAGTRATPRTRPSPMPSLAQAVQSFGGIPGLQLPPDVEVGSIAPLVGWTPAMASQLQGGVQSARFAPLLPDSAPPPPPADSAPGSGRSTPKAKRRGGGSGGAAEPAAPPPLPALRGSDVLRCPAEQLTPQNLQRLLAPLENGAPWCQQAQPSPRKHTQDMSSASPLVCEGEGAAAGWPLSLRWLAAGVLLARLQTRNAPVAAQPSSADSEHSDLQRALQTLVELPESASTPTSSAGLAAAMAVLVKVAALPQGPAVRATRFAKDGSLQPDPSVPPAPQAFVQAVLAFQSAALQAMRFDAAASACLGKPAAVPPPLGACLPDDLLAQASRDMLEAALTGSAPEPALPPPVDWAERVLATDELRNLDAACRLGGSWCAPDSQGSTGAVTRAASTFRQWVLGGEAPAEPPLPQPLPALGLPEGLAVEAVDAPVAAAAATP